MNQAALYIPVVALLGAIIGSFLNVVIYRLPRGLSVHQPRWSFCPQCQRRIRAFDNIPILSWLWLRGRCRDCGAVISMVYPAIEIATMLLFVVVWDAFFVARAIPGFGTWPNDWPMVVGYLALFASLLAISGMDLESYSIDIRVTIFAMIVGLAAHTIQGFPVGALKSPVGMPKGLLPPALCAIGVLMGATWVGVTIVIWCFSRSSQPNPADTSGPDHETPAETEKEPSSVTAREASSAWLIVIFAVIALGMVVWVCACPDFRFGRTIAPAGERGILGGLVFMLLLILASMIHRPADQEIVEELEEGRPASRALAWREAAEMFLPLIAGIVAFILLRHRGWLDKSWTEALSIAARHGSWLPYVANGAAALAGLVFAAALGWTVRILGTLAFGKEAFGTGDIYIMAAIGATAGFWFVLFGFFLAALLALIGVIVLTFKKNSRAIPFGPWLALGAFATLWLEGLLLDYFGEAGALFWSLACGKFGGSGG